jgi:hypothetical protein
VSGAQKVTLGGKRDDGPKRWLEHDDFGPIHSFVIASEAKQSSAASPFAMTMD